MLKITYRIGSSMKERMILITDLNSLLVEIVRLMGKKVTFTSMEGVNNDETYF